MKTIILAVVGLLILAPLVKAESLDLSLADTYMTTCLELKQPKDVFVGIKIDVANFQELIYLSLGIVTPDVNLSRKIILTGLSLNLRTALKRLGWNWNLNSAIKVGGYMGMDILDVDKKTYAGIDVNIKF